MYQAAGSLWMKLLEEFIPKGLTSENFWQLLVVHNGNATYIPLNSLWQHISVPLIENEKGRWIKISGLTKLVIRQSEDGWHFVMLDNQHIKLPLSFAEWEKSGNEHPKIQSQINIVVLALSRLEIENGRVIFTICPPDDNQITATSLAIRGDMHYIQTLRYMNNLKDVITAQVPIKTANYSHPLVQQCLKVQDNDTLSKFASSFVRCIVDTICSKKQERSFENPDRWMKYSAHCYFAVDWSKYQDNLLKPPYKIWLENNEIFEITENDLQRWRDSKSC